MNWLALSWVAMALICGRYNALIWWDAIADYRWTEARELPQSRVMTASDQLMIHSFLLAVQVVMFVIGIVAWTAPASPNAPITLPRLIVIGGLLSIEVMLAVMAVWSRHNWQRILRVIERERARRGQTS